MRTGQKKVLGTIRGINPIWEKIFEKEIQGAGLLETIALLHCDRENGSHTLVDETAGHTVNAFGATHVWEPKFSQALFLDGTNSYLSIPDSNDWNFGSGRFTIDFWIKPASDTYGEIYNHDEASNNVKIFVSASSGNIGFNVQVGGSNVVVLISASGVLTVGQWHHVAVVRGWGGNVNDWALCVDGATVATTTGNSTVCPDITSNLYIGARADSSDRYCHCWIDEFRVSKGVARWTAGFTPPSAAYTSDANTQLLLHCDGIAGSTTITDSGNTGHTVTANGNAYIFDGTAKSGFGEVLAFPDDTSYAWLQDANDLTLGQTFTIEGWYKFEDISNQLWLMTKWDNNTGMNQKSWRLWWNQSDSKLYFGYSDDGATDLAFSKSWSPSVGTWYHIAVVRDNANLYFFVNGTQLGTTENIGTTQLYDSDRQLVLGGFHNNNVVSSRYLGVMDEIRISRVARWIANFTPSSSPYTLTGVPDTRLLVHPNSGGVDGDTLVDDAMGRHAIATNGAAQTYAEKFNNAGFFDGLNSYITTPDSADFTFGSSPFTIDLWVKFRNITSNQSFYFQGPDSTHRTHFTYIGSSKILVFNVGNGADLVEFTCPFAPIIGKWYHLALVRVSATVWKIFVNGESRTLTLTAGSYNITIPDWGTVVTVGRWSGGINSNYCNGWIDEFRVSKGVARWEDEFDVPTEPYNADSNTQLLLHFDEVVGTTTPTDSSASGHVMTGNGNFYVFDGKVRKEIGDLVLAFPTNFYSTGDYFDTPDHADFAIGSEDFTIETWVKFHADLTGTNEQIILAQYDNVNNYWVLSQAMLGTGEREIKFEIKTGGSTVVDLSARVSEEFKVLGHWHYVAVVRSGDKWGLLIDGMVVDITDYAGVFPDYSARVTIGRWDGASPWYFQGVMQGLRVSHVARYGLNTFAVPTAAYTPDAYDVLLMHMDSAVTDATGRHTPVNTGVSFNTSIKKFGSASADFGGTLADYITIPASIDFAFGEGDFTIDMWVYHDVSGNARTYIMQDDGVASWAFGRNAQGRYAFQLVYGGVNSVYLFSRKQYTFGVGTWVHVALVRKGIKWTIFVNGEPAVAQQNGAYVPYIDGPLYIGQYTTVGNPVDGKIDELRISKGIARWDNEFTSPNTPFTDGQVTHLVKVEGLDGDEDELYMIRVYHVAGTSAFPNRIDVQLNGDVENNYGHQFLRAISSTVAAARVTSFSGMQLSVASGSELSVGETLLFARSGKVRSAVNQHCGGVVGTVVDRVILLTQAWDNVDDVIRELWFLSNNVNGIGEGSRMEVYRKAREI